MTIELINRCEKISNRLHTLTEAFNPEPTNGQDTVVSDEAKTGNSAKSSTGA